MTRARNVLIGVAVAAFAIFFLVYAAADRKSDVPTNVKPPAPGVPAHENDVHGIYRNVDQSLLQLRGGGRIDLTTDRTGASSGTYTLDHGRLQVRSDGCDGVIGTYEVQVTGPQEPGDAALVLRAVDDTCVSRRVELTRDRWVYANS